MGQDATTRQMPTVTMEYTLFLILTSSSVGDLHPASDPGETGCPSLVALATVYLALFVHEALLL